MPVPPGLRNINITWKEAVASVVFLFTMSGVWYKLYYESADQRLKMAEMSKALEDSRKEHENRIRILEDAELRRKSIEEARDGTIYYPTNKPR